MEGTGLLSPPLPRGLDAQRTGLLFCQGKEKPKLPTLEGSGILAEGCLWPETAGKPGAALGGGHQAQPVAEAEQTGQEGVEERGRGESRRVGWPAGGVCHELKAHHFAEIYPGLPKVKDPRHRSSETNNTQEVLLFIQPK